MLRNYLIVVTLLLVAFVVAGVTDGWPQVQISRTFWKVPLDTLAVGHPKHTHVSITGTVAYRRFEEDGDLHIRIRNDTTGRFIIAECIPELMCAKPDTGVVITVRGISRQDPEHLWWEVHPVESWTRVP